MQIPFGTAVSGAYRWTFRNFLSVLGIGWLPHLLIVLGLGALAYFALPAFTALIELAKQGEKPDPAQFMPLVWSMIGLEALALPIMLLFSAMATVGLVRKALGLHPGPSYVFFSLDSQVWRLMGAYILLVLIAWGGMIVVGLAIAVIAAALTQVSQGAAIFAGVVLGTAAFVFYLYAIVRTWFFIPAIVVAENHIGLRRSWHLGRGNFWRIVGIFLAVSLPCGFAFNVLSQTVMQIAVGGMANTMLHPNATPQEALATVRLLLAALVKTVPFLLPLLMLYMIALAGLLAAASVNAYRLVTGGQDIGPEARPAPAA